MARLSPVISICVESGANEPCLFRGPVKRDRPGTGQVAPADKRTPSLVHFRGHEIACGNHVLASESHVLWRGYPPGSLKGVYDRFQ